MDQPLTLRRVTKDDAKLLYEWRNDEETRKQSQSITPVEWDEHAHWIENSLKNPDRILVIAERGGTPVGTCRADVRADGFTEISYTIAPQERGRGLSKPMVQQFVKEYLEGRRLAAHIKKGHKQSESVVIALGMKPFLEIPSKDQNDTRLIVEWR